MKKLLSFIVIFGLGALTFFLVNTVLLNKESGDQSAQTATSTATTSVQDTPLLEEETNSEEDEDEVVITEDGSQLDGPFVLFDRRGDKTGATVSFVRSPEENLIQFENFDGSHSFASHIYLSNDRDATDFLNLGPCRLSEGMLIYGIPLDAQLDNFKYILVFDTQLERVEYYAKVR